MSCTKPLIAKDVNNELQGSGALSMEFLEYLADMSEIDGQLVGPQDMDKPNCEKLDTKGESQEGKELDDGENKKPEQDNDTTNMPYVKECENDD